MATPGSIRERLPEWCLSLEGPRKLVLNGLILIFSLLGSGVVIKAALKQVYVVDAISVPKDLETNGYTSATVGQRIIDAVSDINRVAAMTKQVGIYALSEADPSRPDSADFEGPAALQPVDYVELNWSAEEWTRGAYAATFAVGGLSRFGPDLRRPIGPIHWASSDLAGVGHMHMEGAIRSGERVANALIGQICGEPEMRVA